MQKLKAVQQMLQYKYIYFQGEFLVTLYAMKKMSQKQASFSCKFCFLNACYWSYYKWFIRANIKTLLFVTL